MITAEETRAATCDEVVAVIRRHGDELGVESEYAAEICYQCADLVDGLAPPHNMGDLARSMWLIQFIETHQARSGAQILVLLREQGWST